MQHQALLVDDDPLILESAKLGLEQAGWQVVTAHGGHDAIGILEASRPDLVLIDIMMPDMDGRELLQAIRSRDGHADTPVVALSKRQDLDATLLELGASGVMRKPFDPAALSDVLLTYLR